MLFITTLLISIFQYASGIMTNAEITKSIKNLDAVQFKLRSFLLNAIIKQIKLD